MKMIQLVEMKFNNNPLEEMTLPVYGPIRAMTYDKYNGDLDGAVLRFHMELEKEDDEEEWPQVGMDLVVVRTGTPLPEGEFFYWASEITYLGLIHVYEKIELMERPDANE